jgi:LysM repeat protein
MSPRLLAPVALAVAFLAVVLVISSSGGSSSSQDAATTATTAKPAAKKPGKAAAKKKSAGAGAKTARVGAGDTLGAISQRTGVPVSRLQQLNPGLNASALTVGETVKLKP